MQARRSDGTTLPTWGQLLSELFQFGQSLGKLLPLDIIDSISQGALLEAGQELQDYLSADELSTLIREIFREHTIVLSSAHASIPRMRWRAILTTNYDGLLERAYVEDGTPDPTVLTYDDYLARNRDPLRNNDFFIFKVHGDLRQPRSIILGTRSYQDLIHYNPGYRFLVESILNAYTVLFVGFGGGDPDINHVLDALASRHRKRDDRHYILMPRKKWSPVERRRHLLDRGLETIEYDPCDDHAQLACFLQELSRHRLHSHRPAVAYSSRSSGGSALRSVIENLQADAIDTDALDAAGWFDDARARLEISEVLVLTGGGDEFAEKILRSLADELTVPVLNVPCDVTLASGQLQSLWSAQIAQALTAIRSSMSPS